MKTMTCKQLGGGCDHAFQANTFEELVDQSKQHGMEMFMQQDAQHLEAMARIQEMMKDPEAIKSWFDTKKQEFEVLAND